jgi:hypothetical protein
MRRSGTWCAAIALLMLACTSEKGIREPDAKVKSDGGASDAGMVQVGPPYNTCTVDSDCAWGEIEHEIRSKKDCVCLYGCPYIPLSKQTVERRAAQHAQFCSARVDGNGDPCGIDDCSEPGALVCNQGVCEAATGRR